MISSQHWDDLPEGRPAGAAGSQTHAGRELGCWDDRTMTGMMGSSGDFGQEVDGAKKVGPGAGAPHDLARIIPSSKLLGNHGLCKALWPRCAGKGSLIHHKVTAEQTGPWSLGTLSSDQSGPSLVSLVPRCTIGLAVGSAEGQAALYDLECI